MSKKSTLDRIVEMGKRAQNPEPIALTHRLNRVYVAGPFGAIKEIDDVAEELKNHGLTIVSSWHTGTNLPKERALLQNKFELESADCVVACAAKISSGMPMRETYVEIGRALALGKRVIVLFGDAFDFLSLRDPLVSTAPTVELAALAATRVVPA